jgi:MFS family permease
MNKILKNSWALFLGMGALMLAYGFQGSLLGVRAVKEEFSITATGFMMSGYFVGYFIGAITIPKLISRVGHIRIFAAFASIASLVILVHAIFINPFVWFLLRVLTGISMVSIYTVAESWLNDRASNKNRGSVLSIYMVILYGAMGCGMLFLNFSNPPTFKKIEAMSLQEVYISSPFGMVSSFFYGTIQSALFTLLAVYAAGMNFSIFQISIVTFLLAISGAISQWPIGKLSDMYDRRKVIIVVSFAAAFFALCAILASGQMYLPDGLATSKFWFYIFLILFSFCSLPMFSLILAHTNDFIPKEKFVAAGASLQFTFGLGAMGGPFLCSIFMNLTNLNGFFVFLMFFHILIGVYGVYRSRVRPVVENPDSQFVAMPQSITPAGIELNPTTEPIDEPLKEENKEKITL